MISREDGQQHGRAHGRYFLGCLQDIITCALLFALLFSDVELKGYPLKVSKKGSLVCLSLALASRLAHVSRLVLVVNLHLPFYSRTRGVLLLDRPRLASVRHHTLFLLFCFLSWHVFSSLSG